MIATMLEGEVCWLKVTTKKKLEKKMLENGCAGLLSRLKQMSLYYPVNLVKSLIVQKRRYFSHFRVRYILSTNIASFL